MRAAGSNRAKRCSFLSPLLPPSSAASELALRRFFRPDLLEESCLISLKKYVMDLILSLHLSFVSELFLLLFLLLMTIPSRRGSPTSCWPLRSHFGMTLALPSRLQAANGWSYCVGHLLLPQPDTELILALYLSLVNNGPDRMETVRRACLDLERRLLWCAVYWEHTLYTPGVFRLLSTEECP